MCCFLVSGFLKEIIQQIHSLRASGVRLFHASSIAEEEVRAFRKSAGTACTILVAGFIAFIFSFRSGIEESNKKLKEAYRAYFFLIVAAHSAHLLIAMLPMPNQMSNALHQLMPQKSQ
jgi:heme/copper-type cytochrome/quinol oxidase subunit 3